MDSGKLFKKLKFFLTILFDDIFVETILVSNIIIFEFLNFSQPFLYSAMVTFVISAVKVYRNTFISTILTYDLFKYREFKNFNVLGTLNMLIAVAVITYLCYTETEIRLLTVLIFMVLRAILTLELNYVQDILTIEVVSSILYGYDFEIPDCFKNEYLRQISELMEDYKRRDRARVEENLKREKLKVNLITNISHDLKTPLTSIINYSDLLSKKDELDEEGKNFIKILNRNSKRMKTLISDLIFASKANSRNINVEKSLIEMNELINQIYGDYDSLFKKKTIWNSYIRQIKMIF